MSEVLIVVTFLGLFVWVFALTLRVDSLRVKTDCIDDYGPLYGKGKDSLRHQVSTIRNGVLDQYNMIHSLARALGYEWKRTEAKEGWEKKPTAYEDMRVSPSWGCVSPFSSASRACSEKVDADVMALLKRRKTDHEPTADRRKGERRKPAPKKKPRRVTR